MWKADERSEKKKYEMLQQKQKLNTKRRIARRRHFFCLGLETKQ
jgi:hypothetical protein